MSGRLAAAVWRSTDGGITWVRTEQQTGVFEGAAIRDTAVTPVGLLAVGESAASVAWVSADAITWEPLPLNDEVFGGATLYAITVRGDIVVLAGERFGGAAIWAMDLGS